MNLAARGGRYAVRRDTDTRDAKPGRENSEF